MEQSKKSVLDRYRFKDETIETDLKINRVSPKKEPRISKNTVRKKIKIEDGKILDNLIYRDLQPSLNEDVKLVFVGFNPGIQSSLQQHHYAHFTNLFWKLFNQSKILLSVLHKYDEKGYDDTRKQLLSEVVDQSTSTTFVKPEHDFELVHFGIGFTDLILRCTRSAAELTKAEKLANVTRLIDEFKVNKPAFVVIVGKGIWECIIEYLGLELELKYKLDKNSSFKWGKQDPEQFHEADKYRLILQKCIELTEDPDLNLYVFPNTSGLVASLKYDEKLKMWVDLSNDILNSTL